MSSTKLGKSKYSGRNANKNLSKAVFIYVLVFLEEIRKIKQLSKNAVLENAQELYTCIKQKFEVVLTRSSINLIRILSSIKEIGKLCVWFDSKRLSSVPRK